jgi:hypothetical protein
MNEETRSDGNKGIMKESHKQRITGEREKRILQKEKGLVKSKLVNGGM